MLVDGVNLIEATLSKNVMIGSMTKAQRLALSSLNAGEIVFQTDDAAGLWHYTGTFWQPLAVFDINGKIPLDRFPSTVLGDLRFKGTFDATNGSALPSPSTVQDATYNVGHFYICNVAGTYNSIAYSVKDWAISDGTAWFKISNVDSVRKVNSTDPDANGNIDVIFGGDVSTNVTNKTLTVNKIKNIELSATAPTNGQVLEYNSTEVKAKWVDKSLPSITGDVTFTNNVSKVISINGTSVPSTPTSGQVLVASSGTTAIWGTVKDKTAITGVLKGDGTSVSAATAGTDFIAPTTVNSEKRVYDQLGDLRGLPNVDKTAAFTIAKSDAGKNITVSGVSTATKLFTLSPTTLDAGMVISVFNKNNVEHTFDMGAIETYIAGGDGTNLTGKVGVKLAKYGLVTIHYVTSSLVILSGNVS